jgi:hypothetical protein
VDHQWTVGVERAKQIAERVEGEVLLTSISCGCPKCVIKAAMQLGYQLAEVDRMRQAGSSELERLMALQDPRHVQQPPCDKVGGGDEQPK